jgi:uncharacterized membrane protein YqjE
MIALAEAGSNGLAMVGFMAVVIVVLWPVYRWAFRGLGIAFIIAGAYLTLVAASSGQGDLRHALGLVVGGVALRIISSLRLPRRRAPVSHDGRSVRQEHRHAGTIR